MSKFHETKNNNLAFHCLGCDMVHVVDSRWKFNNDFEKPTIHPSLLVRYTYRGECHVCHSFIEDGMMQYLSDCTHQLSGETVEIPDFEITHPDWNDL